jgi:hypothetical protein
VPRLDAFGLTDADRLADQQLTYLFTRQRIDPATPNEAPAEPSLVREFEVPDERSFVLSGEARLGERLHRDRDVEAIFDLHHEVHHADGIEVGLLHQVGVPREAAGAGADGGERVPDGAFDRGGACAGAGALSWKW